MVTKVSNKLPSWIRADWGTMKFDKTLPSKGYSDGLAYAKEWQFPHIDHSPLSHTYNIDEFLRKQQIIYQHIKSSDLKKSDLKKIKRKKPKVYEFDVWDGAPLRWLAYEIGHRLLPGLYAEAIQKNDLTYYYSFKKWIETTWLKMADEVSNDVLWLGRAYRRTNEMMHFYEATLDTLRENINLSDYRHPDTFTC